jgi:hypothetical protein
MDRVLLEADDDSPEDQAVTLNGRAGNGRFVRGNAFPRPQNTRHDEGYVPRRQVTGTHSRALDRGGLSWTISGRSREGRFITTYENLLVEHLGHEPSITEKLLIQRAARTACHIELLDERALAVGELLSTSDHNRYCAWSNSLTRILIRLGLERGKADEPRLELSDWIADRSKRYSHTRKVP